MYASIVTKEQKTVKLFYAEGARLERQDQSLSFVMSVNLILKNLPQVVKFNLIFDPILSNL